MTNNTLAKISGQIPKCCPIILEKEEDIDIKIRSVSNWKFRFQSQNFCFKLILFVLKCFFAVKISENNRFCRSPGVMTNAAYIENGVGGI